MFLAGCFILGEIAKIRYLDMRRHYKFCLLPNHLIGVDVIVTFKVGVRATQQAKSTSGATSMIFAPAKPAAIVIIFALLIALFTGNSFRFFNSISRAGEGALHIKSIVALPQLVAKI